jgi:cell division ATPase FtsA
MNEILQNVRYQIEESNEHIGHIIFTGGGSKLKNLDLLLGEYLPNYKCDIVSEPKFSLISNNGVNVNGIFTTALYSLLKLGNVNCCEELKPATYTPPVEQKLMFIDDQDEATQENNKTEESPKKEEKNEKKQKPKKQSAWERFKKGARDLFDEMTQDESDDNNDNN